MENMSVELAKKITSVSIMNPNMTEEEVIAFANKRLKEEKPYLFTEKLTEPETDEIPNYIFHVFDSMDCAGFIEDYLKKNNPDMTDSEAAIKAEKIYYKVIERTIQCNPNLERDLEAEAIFRKAVLDPYEAEQAAKIKNPTPAEVKEDINSTPADQEANFDPSNPALGYFQQFPTMAAPQPAIQQYPVNPMFAHPIHRVDEPPKTPKPIPPEDKVQSDLSQVNFSGLMKPAPINQVPDVISHRLANPEMTTPITENFCNNEVIINKFPKIPLKRIEQIANQNGVSVLFEEYPWVNLVSVTALDAYGQIIAPMCFVIDTGAIIDPRAKVIATNPKVNQNQPLELAPIYELFVIDTKNHNRKILDEKLISDIFAAGILNISKKEMYSTEYKELNTKIALITMPTKGITKEMRNALQDYLMKMDKNGDFDKAISMSPGCRFVFKSEQLNREHLSDFIMINEGVPKFYGTQAPMVNPVIIESKDGKVTIRAGRT